MKSRNRFFVATILASALFIVVLGVNRFTNIAAADERAEHQIYLPIVLNKFVIDPMPNFFGIQVYGRTNETFKYYDQLTELELQTVRNYLPWSSIEPVDVGPDQFNWTQTDLHFSAARTDREDLTFIATFGNNPDWAAENDRLPLFDTAYDDLAEVITAIVERYDGDGIDDAPGSPVIEYLELYNEPDNKVDLISVTGGWGGEPEKYAKMLATAYQAAKSANPAIKVTFGGIAYDFNTRPTDPFDPDFFPDVLTALESSNYPCGYCFDVMNFHAYPNFNYNWVDNDSLGLYEKTEAIRDVMAPHGLRDMPIVVTEAGWHDNTTVIGGESSEELQARYVVEIFTEARAAGIESMIYWLLYDIENYQFHNGLVDFDGNKKPSFDVYQNTVEQLSGTEFEKRLTDAETGTDDMSVYKFTKLVDGTSLYVAWLNPAETDNTGSLQLTGNVVQVTDIYGNVLRSTARDEADGVRDVRDGRATIEISGRPVYIEVIE